MLQNSLLNIDSGLLPHGGALRAAAALYGIPLADWLDLSTGINPIGWAEKELPRNSWFRLPECDDDLIQIARDYCKADYILPVAGSQAAIQALPRLRQPCRVGVVDPGYAEHAHAWRRCGHQITMLRDIAIDRIPTNLDILILIQPNNPTGQVFPPSQILDWHTKFCQNGAWLIVDEAFIDSTPELSLAPYCTRQGLIVLRSLGKFFGLAGARVGFVCAHAELLARLNALLGPWTISSASRWVACAALDDLAWQQRTRSRLLKDWGRLNDLLSEYGLNPDGGCALFRWIKTSKADELHRHLAQLGILTRLFKNPSSLRVGLPGIQKDWEKLDVALATISKTKKTRTAP